MIERALFAGDNPEQLPICIFQRFPVSSPDKDAQCHGMLFPFLFAGSTWQ
jgi:hypothetical protein